MKTAILRNSDEWDLIEFALRLRTRTSRVNLLQAWNISNPESMSVFNTRAHNGIVLETFINTESLDRNNSIQDVCTRGVDVGACGFKVCVGNFSLEGFPWLNSNSQLLDNHSGVLDIEGKLLASRTSVITSGSGPLVTGEKRLYEYFICDCAVGKSIPVANELEAQRLHSTMPLEYDSFCIKRENEPADSNWTLAVNPNENNDTAIYKNGTLQGYSKGVLPQHTFKREYIIYDTSQILPRYLVQFECDMGAPELYALPLCDNCNDEPASIYCPSDEAKVCPKCDHQLHSENKVVGRHVRVSLDRMPRPLYKCSLHPSETIHLYCATCQVPICQVCTANHMHGHGVGDEKDVFVDIDKAYNALVQQVQVSTNLLLTRRRQELATLKEEINRCKKQVVSNCQEVEAQCYDKLQKVLNDLQVAIKSSLQLVLLQQVENRRQLNQVYWSEQYISHVKNTLMPAEYLRAWLQHSLYRRMLDSHSYNKKPTEAFANVQLHGQLGIVLEGSTN